MTSEEIKQKLATDLSANGWLREICLQLAMVSESSKPAPTWAKPTPPTANKGVKKN